MKKLYYIAFITLFTSLFYSCEDFLDIRPEGEIVLQDFWKNESQATQVVMSCYRSLSVSDAIQRMIVWGEVRSDNAISTMDTKSDLKKIIDLDINSSNSYNSWSAFYRTINYCNNFLYFAPGVVDVDENFTEGKLRTLEAEVLTIRALSYFYLIRAFKEVPLITDPSIDDSQEYAVPKSSEREIIDLIISDLNTASKYARQSFSATDYPKGRITQSAVYTLLTDVYLWDQQYELAIESANKILSDESYSLVNAENVLRDVFYFGGSTETIFELVFNDDEMNNSAVRNFYGYSGGIVGEVSFPLFLVNGEKSPFGYQVGSNLESENDIRLKDFVNISNAVVSGYYYVFKYAGLERIEENDYSTYFYSSTSPPWIIYRLSDVMLMKAEALVQLNRNESDLRNALQLVNTTYLRSNPAEFSDSLNFSDYNDGSKMEELVLRERQRELMFEGKRYFDLMRLARRANSPEPLINYVVSKYSGNQVLQVNKMSIMDALYFPILQSELDANAALEQNPFYEVSGSSEITN